MSSNVFLSFWVKHCVKSFICNMWKVVIKNLSLVENRTGIVEVTGSNPIEALIFPIAYVGKFTVMIILHFQELVFAFMLQQISIILFSNPL